MDQSGARSVCGEYVGNMGGGEVARWERVKVVNWEGQSGDWRRVGKGGGEWKMGRG